VRTLERGTRTHYVYFIVAEPVDPRLETLVKIGTAVDVDRRLADIRRGSARRPAWLADLSAARRIDVAGYVEADGEVESMLHRAFAKYRKQGTEWFAIEPLRSDIQAILRAHCVCRGCQREGRGHAHL